ncbi:hypothetical protein F5Y11DRAFT_367183 [Daldinia sp. FL1419]|nr:hypothetical protein F5Y11DRAFT_367183 [Daldinia sp. FL1419]
MRQTNISSSGQDSLTNINLDTVSGFYHWGVFTYDEKINQFIARAYERTPSLQTLKKRSNKGSINAALGPPQITIPSDAHLNLSRVLYQITFNSGTLESANKGTTKLEGWKIALMCDLDTSQVALKDGDAENSPERDFIKKEFRVGDDRERADRLFVELAEANWNRLDNSSMIIDPDTGNPISFNDWQDKVGDGDDEDDRPALFKKLVQSWAKSIQKEFATTLAISTPRSISESYIAMIDRKTSLGPTKYLTQIYAYERADEDATRKNETHSNAQNCLVYLGMSQDEPFPQAKQLLYQGQVLSTTKMTLVAGYQLYLDRFLLPALARFNAATSLSLFAKNGWDFAYEVGLDASGAGGDDGSFHFARSEDGKTYTYHHEANTPDTPIQSLDDRSWCQPEHWSKTTNTFTFNAGSHTATLKGSVDYCQGVKVSDSQDMSSSNNFYRNLDASSWKVDLSLTLKDGILSFEFADSLGSFEHPALLKSDLHKKVAESLRRSIDAVSKGTGISIQDPDLPSFWGARPLSTVGPVLFSSSGGIVLALDQERPGSTEG